jgi:hypothetical protein
MMADCWPLAKHTVSLIPQFPSAFRLLTNPSHHIQYFANNQKSKTGLSALQVVTVVIEEMFTKGDTRADLALPQCHF